MRDTLQRKLSPKGALLVIGQKMFTTCFNRFCLSSFIFCVRIAFRDHGNTLTCGVPPRKVLQARSVPNIERKRVVFAIVVEVIADDVVAVDVFSVFVVVAVDVFAVVAVVAVNIFPVVAVDVVDVIVEVDFVVEEVGVVVIFTGNALGVAGEGRIFVTPFLSIICIVPPKLSSCIFADDFSFLAVQHTNHPTRICNKVVRGMQKA